MSLNSLIYRVLNTSFDLNLLTIHEIQFVPDTKHIFLRKTNKLMLYIELSISVSLKVLGFPYIDI